MKKKNFAEKNSAKTKFRQKKIPKKNVCQKKIAKKKPKKENLPKKIYSLENIKFTKKQGQSKVQARSRKDEGKASTTLTSTTI